MSGLKKMICGNIKTMAGCLWVAVFFAVLSYGLWGWTMPFPLRLVLFFLGSLAVAVIVRLLAAHTPLARLDRKLTDFLNANLSDREFAVLISIFILIPWVLAYLALFPGTYGYDVPLQTAQFFGFEGARITSHHPVAHTVLVGVVLSLGNFLFHSYTAGFALFTAFQMFMVVGCSVRVLLFLKRRRASTLILLAGTLWFSWNPILQMLGLNATKDILFGVFLVHFTIDFWNRVEGREGDGILWFRLTVWAVLMCLFRNQGIYILLALAVLSLLFGIRKKELYISLLSAFFFSVIFFAVCTYAMKMESVDKKEMLPLPMQQVAYVCHFYLQGDSSVNLTEEQFEIVREVIPDESVMEYLLFDSADPVKAAFQTDVLSRNPARYVKTYLAIGFQNPRLYREALMYMVLPYWDMTLNEYCDMALKYPFSEMNFLDIRQESRLGKYYNYLEDVALKIKGGFWLKLSGAAMWLLIVLYGAAIARGNKKQALGCMPVLLYVLTMLLGPVALLRYLFPTMLAVPVLLGALFMRSIEKIREE